MPKPLSPFPNEAIEHALVCDAYTNMDASYKRQNMNAFLEYSYVPQYYKCQKNICEENAVRFPKGNELCDKNVALYRGQNNRPPRNIPISQPFLIQPCQYDTYDNALICDDGKCCSKSTQLFCNMTKRSAPKSCKP